MNSNLDGLSWFGKTTLQRDISLVEDFGVSRASKHILASTFQFTNFDFHCFNEFLTVLRRLLSFGSMHGGQVRWNLRDFMKTSSNMDRSDVATLA